MCACVCVNDDRYPTYLRKVYYYWVSCFKLVPVSDGEDTYQVVGNIINKTFPLQGGLGQIQEVREKVWDQLSKSTQLKLIH